MRRSGKHSTRMGAILMSFFLSLFLLSCAQTGEAREPPERRDGPMQDKQYARLVTMLKQHITNEATQAVVVVKTPGELHRGTLYAMEHRGDTWQGAIHPFDIVIGRNGFARAGEKREGDGRTPSGMFPLGTVFGYAGTAPTKMPYRQATEKDIWVDDPGSPFYNRWIQRGSAVVRSFENMRLSDDRYKYGIVIEYNTRPVAAGHGSAIFFHIWKGEGLPTSGCVAMSEEHILRLIGWLDPSRKPVAVLGLSASEELPAPLTP